MIVRYPVPVCFEVFRSTSTQATYGMFQNINLMLQGVLSHLFYVVGQKYYAVGCLVSYHISQDIDMKWQGVLCCIMSQEVLGHLSYWIGHKSYVIRGPSLYHMLQDIYLIKVQESQPEPEPVLEWSPIYQAQARLEQGPKIYLLCNLGLYVEAVQKVTSSATLNLMLQVSDD